MNTLFSFVAGLVFGLGLLISGMTNPAKVLGFLDLAGRWDPSLALVMAGAIAVGAVAFALARGREKTWLGLPMDTPDQSRIDRRLVIGSVLFGAGWGLAGICPGPGVVLAGAGLSKGLLYCGAMIAGMAAFEALERWMPARHSAA